MTATTTWTRGEDFVLGSMDAGAVYDSKRKRMVIFGGTDVTGLTNRVWSYDMPPATGGWTQIYPAGTGPDPRSRPAVAYVSTEDMLVSFGGSGGGNGSLWLLDFDAPGGPAWNQVQAYGTSPWTEDAQAVYDPVGNRVIVVSPNNGVFALSWPYGVYSAWQWTTLWEGSTVLAGVAAPGFGCAYDSANRRIIVFGGCYLGSCPYQAYALPLQVGNPQWTPVGSGGPGSRSYATMVYDADALRVLLYGGESYAQGDLWELSLSGTPTWTVLADGGALPDSRSHQAAIYDVRSDRMVVLGGLAEFGTVSHVTSLLETSDTEAPGAVTDLAADIVGPNDILMAWTAPGDDGNTGTAEHYDLRIAPFPLDEQTFNLGTSADPQPLTEAAGTYQEYRFSGLNKCTQYYFAIKTWDEAGHVSPISPPYYMRTLCPGGGLLFGSRSGGLPVTLSLDALGPNPARTATAVQLAVPADRAGEGYRLEVFGVSGRRVRLLESGMAVPGRRRVEWNLRDDGGEPVADGIYLMRLSVAGDRLVRRIAVIR